MNLEDLTPDEHAEREIGDLIASLEEYGYQVSLVVSLRKNGSPITIIYQHPVEVSNDSKVH